MLPLLLSWRPKWECLPTEGIPKLAACLEWGQVTCLQPSQAFTEHLVRARSFVATISVGSHHKENPFCREANQRLGRLNALPQITEQVNS